jgi:hypothetical protein
MGYSKNKKHIKQVMTALVRPSLVAKFLYAAKTAVAFIVTNP